jgi:hypothetical protein
MVTSLGELGRAAAIPLTLVALGCGSGGGGQGGGGAQGTTSTTSTTTTNAPAFVCTGEPADHVDLSGNWAAYGEIAVKMQGVAGGAITICPADQSNVATLLLMLTIDQDAADPKKLPTVKATLCSLELPVVTALVGDCDPTSQSLVSAQIIAPPSLLAALPHVATQPATGTLSTAQVGAALALTPIDVIVGTSKGGAALPAWNTAQSSCDAPNVGRTSACEASCVSDCAAMRDDDADGFPGVTVSVCGYTPDDGKKGVKCNADAPNDPGATLQGRAFIDIEVNPTFTGTVKSSCEMKGAVDTQVLYHLTGADVWLTGAPIGVSSAIQSLPDFVVDPAASKFRMVRIDGRYGAPDWQADPAAPGAACAALIAHQNEL